MVVLVTALVGLVVLAGLELVRVLPLLLAQLILLLLVLVVRLLRAVLFRLIQRLALPKEMTEADQPSARSLLPVVVVVMVVQGLVKLERLVDQAVVVDSVLGLAELETHLR